jgi:3-deoxy-manno-octulosonate cytidylyltransferase (CMP-KDO synthetase)
MKPSKLELLEKLEQLRVLENGYKIKVVEVKNATVPVDTLEDLQKVRKILTKKN